MKITASDVNKLRQSTGAGMMDCKKALEESNGDFEKAVEILRKKGQKVAANRADRESSEGVVLAKVSDDNTYGIIVSLNCETDFVAKTDGFTELAHNLAMQIAATNPVALDRDSIDISVINREKDIFTDQAKAAGKPDNIIERMVEGRLNKFYQESCLLDQTYIKDPDKRVNDLITETVATLGENISINRFVRFAIGETDLSSNGQA